MVTINGANDLVRMIKCGETGVSKKETLIKDLLDFCNEPRTMAEITGHLRIKDQNYIKDSYINPLLGTKMAMTKPDVPTSPKQKYYTIHKD